MRSGKGGSGEPSAYNHMKLNHIHLQVRDLNVAVHWFQTILQIKPGFQNDRLATLSFALLLTPALSTLPQRSVLKAMTATATSARSSSAAEFNRTADQRGMGCQGGLLQRPRRSQMRNRGPTSRD